MSVAGFLHQQRTRIAKLSRRVRGADDVHDLRVATRRARAALWMLEQSGSRELESFHLRRLARELRRLTRALGRVRELDVALADAERFGLEPVRLAHQRRKRVRKLACELAGPRRRRLTRDLKQLEGALMRGARNPQGLDRALESVRTEARRWEERALTRKPALHRLRISFKRARYVLEALGRPTRGLPALQDLLGELHDLEVLQRLLGRHPRVQARQRALIARAGRAARPALRRLAKLK